MDQTQALRFAIGNVQALLKQAEDKKSYLDPEAEKDKASELDATIGQAKAFLDLVIPKPAEDGFFYDAAVKIGDKIPEGAPAGSKWFRRFCLSCKNETTRFCQVTFVEGSDQLVFSLPVVCPHCGMVTILETPMSPIQRAQRIPPKVGDVIPMPTGALPRRPR